MRLAHAFKTLSCLVVVSACEPETVPPTSPQVCLPLASAEKPELCATEACVATTTDLTVDQTSGTQFLMGSACPSAADVACGSVSYSNITLQYTYVLGPADSVFALHFGGELCARGLSTAALRETLLGGTSSRYIPASSGGDGYTGAPMPAADIEIVAYSGGRLHVRARAHYATLERGSALQVCKSGTGYGAGASCRCSFAGAPFDYTFDLNVPLRPLAY